MKKDPGIVVIYLAWLPYGIGYFKDFIKSYQHYPAGYDHKLVIAFNGQAFLHPDNEEAYKEILLNNNITVVEYLHFESGQDISIYAQASSIIDADHFLFLNTYSQFENANWLLHYVNNWKGNVGLIGASGSYASYLSAIKEHVKFDLKTNGSLSFKIKKIIYLLKISFKYGSEFKKFPAPHIRSNAFFTSKKIFSSLVNSIVKNKMQAYFFENGKNSMTEQVLKMGHDCILIDKNGKCYDIPSWPQSRIFWNANQEDLLISDNQTRIYNNLPPDEKKLYRKMAWNKIE